MKTLIKIMAAACCIIAADCGVDGYCGKGIFVKQAEARVGRPLTPGSVAGVARRTTRRTIRRSATYVAVLPRGCSTVVIEGVSLYRCGGVYYQASGNQYVIVNVN